MKVIRIGSEIVYHPWSGSPVTAKIKAIEITKAGTKYGRSVTRCDLEKHFNGTVDLDNGHW